MKKLVLGLICLLGLYAQAQVKIEEIESGILKEKRTISIFTPPNYSETTLYPLIIVFDGEYLFDPMVANVNYYSYFEEMPEAIIVGINQKGLREEDSQYDPETGFPFKKGNDFFEFINIELIPYLESQYTIANFKLAVGHGITANFINYFLFKDQQLFNAYINLSPDFAPDMEERLAKRLAQFKEKKFYYMATAENDLKKNKNSIKQLDAYLKQIQNTQLYYYFDDFETANHNSTAVYAIPHALNKIFSIFKPITPEEYKSKILTMDEPVINYLYDKYNSIENLFDLKKEILINDYMAIYAACRKKEDPESLEKLAELARRDYPETMMYDFFMGEFYEFIGKPKKAVKHFQEAFAKEEIDFMTKDLAYEKMQGIKTDFGE